MSTAIDSRLGAALHAAHQHVHDVLTSDAGQPVVLFCLDLVTWVLTGAHKPLAAPTDRVRETVRAAVNAGLRESFGGENATGIDQRIQARRDAL